MQLVEMKNNIPTKLKLVRQQNNYMPNKKTIVSNNQHYIKVKPRKWNLVEEYCENSTVHGLRYFSNKKIHLFERIWWVISVSLSLVACSISISSSYKKWNENPVIVTFSEKMTPLKEIPFPAVTVCPETKTQRSIFNYTETLLKVKLDSPPPYYGLSEKEFKLAAAQFQICDSYIVENRAQIGENFTKDNIFELIREVAPNITQAFISCSFRTYRDFCQEYFQEVMTDEGLCFTFNSLPSNAMFTDDINGKIMPYVNMSGLLQRWTLEDGYESGYNDNAASDIYLYPYRVFSSGSKAGLKIIMSLKEDDMDYICRGPSQGFKVVLHSPNELPQVTSKYFRIPIGQDVRVSIKPNLLRTTNSLKNFKPERRQCFFNSERKLRYMKSYTQRNCELECLANFTLAICGCVKFSMPHDSNTPICGIAKVMCYNNAENGLLEDTGSDDTSLKINSCNCLPACTSITYDTEMSQATYEYENYFHALNVTAETEAIGLQFASISIFFKENQFITSKRTELVGLTDFISSCGGLLGLFMGVSILSIVEVIYYSSLRLFCSIRSNKIEKKAIEKKSLPKLKARSDWRRSAKIIGPEKPWFIGK